MARVKKTLQNAKISVLFYLVSILTAFFTRKIFLDYLGDDFIGLVGTLKSILGFLNIAELGIGTAISFTLYKPLFDKNNKEINKLVYLIGFLYRRLAVIILVGGIILSLFFPFIFKDQTISIFVVYFGFYSYLLASVFGFFINYSEVVLRADQKGYIIVSFFQSYNIIRQITQAIIAYYLQSMILWLLMELIFSFLNSYFINKKVNKIYPFLKNKVELTDSIYKTYPLVVKKIKQVFVHKISSFVTSGTDQILIYALVSLKSVAFFGNYYLIFSQVNAFANNLFSGMASGVGNLIAENNAIRIQRVFWEMFSLRAFMAGIVVVNIFFLINPFIILWVGKQYILEDFIIYLMLVNLIMQLIRLPIDNYITAYGLYGDTWAPIAQIVINLTISIIFGLKMGIAGIMLGTTISMFIIIFLWKPYFLFNKGLKKNVFIDYWPNFLKSISSLFIAFIPIYLLFNQFIVVEADTFLNLLLNVLKLNTLSLIILPLVFYILNQGFRDFTNRILIMIKKK